MELQKSDAHSFLCEHPLGVVVTQDADGAADTAAIYFKAEEDFSCYFITRETTRKFENAVERKKATISAYDEDSLSFAEVKGTLERVMDIAESLSAVEELQKIIATRRTGYWVPPVTQFEGDRYVVFKLRPKSARYIQYGTESSDNAEPQSFEMSL